MTVDELKSDNARLRAEVVRLREVGNVAFFEMCKQRDTPDAERFQSAIDELGEALAR